MDGMSKDQEKLLETARKRFRKCVEFWDAIRKEALEDLRFKHGDQWPDEIKAARERDNRPCLVINRLTGPIDQVVGDQRQNRPKIKTIPMRDDDEDMTEVLDGLIRAIEHVSHADMAYDMAFEYAVSCGLGAFRVDVDFADSESFDQDILIRTIANPFSVYIDPGFKEPDASDMVFAFVTSIISEEDFEAQYGK